MLIVRMRTAHQVLRKLRPESATGPDGIPTRILKACAKSLALPLAKLGRRIISAGQWPTSWKTHWVFPLHKKRSRQDPGNYRGIQLTSQLSKAMERLLGHRFLPYLVNTGAYGDTQYAYTPGRGARDAISYFTLSWLRSMSRGSRIVVYCSDVSGAFDRVDVGTLSSKLAKTGIDNRVQAVLRSWLAPRQAQVIVKGKASARMEMTNMVYQGTVWGPALWNVRYADTCYALCSSGFEDMKGSQ